MRHRYRIVLPIVALGTLLVPALALAQSATTGCMTSTAGNASTCLTNGLFDTILSMVENTTSNWTSIGAGKSGIAWDLFTGLATLELTWWGLTNALRKTDLGEWFSSLFLKMLELSFFGMIVATAPTWMPFIPQAFENVGEKFLAASQFGDQPGTLPPLTPSGIMTEAWNVEKVLWNGGNPTRVDGGINPSTAAGASPAGGGSSPSSGGCTGASSLNPLCYAKQDAENAMEGLLASLGTLVTMLLLYLGFGLVALQLMMTLIELYMVLGIGSVMLGFLGSRWTVQFGERYASYAASVGVKLLTTYGVVAVMMHLGQEDAAWLNQLSAGHVLPLPDMMALGVSGVLGGVLSMTIPSVAGSIMGGAASLGLSHMTSAGGTIARGAAAGGLGAAAGALAVGGVAKATLGRMVALTSVAGSPAGSIGGAGSSIGGFKGGAGAIASTPPAPRGGGEANGTVTAATAGGGAARGAASASAGAAVAPASAAESAEAAGTAGSGPTAGAAATGTSAETAGQAATGPRFAERDAAARPAPAPSTGGPDQLTAPGSGATGAGPKAADAEEKSGPSTASRLWKMAQHHAGSAHRGLPHEGSVSAPGIRFGHSED